MKKRYKRLVKNDKIYILYWEMDGVLFGPDWKSVAMFDNTHANQQRCKEIVSLMNKCDRKTDDRKRNNDNRTDMLGVSDPAHLCLLVSEDIPESG